jgi:hypothetical protein
MPSAPCAPCASPPVVGAPAPGKASPPLELPFMGLPYPLAESGCRRADRILARIVANISQPVQAGVAPACVYGSGVQSCIARRRQQLPRPARFFGTISAA